MNARRKVGSLKRYKDAPRSRLTISGITLRCLSPHELAQWHERLQIIQFCRDCGIDVPGPRRAPNPFVDCTEKKKISKLRGALTWPVPKLA